MRLKNMKIKVSKRIVLIVLLQLCAVANCSLFTIHYSLLHAQGLPLIRNFTAAEYGGHNRNYDIEIGEDGTVFVANFEGLLYYDRAQWRMIHAPELRRVTVVYRDSKNTVWVGGYNFISRLKKRANGELYMQQISGKDTFKGEVMEIFEEGASLQLVVSDNNIYEVEDAAVPTVKLKKHTNARLLSSVEADVVSVEALQASVEDAVLRDTTQTEILSDNLQVKVKRGNGLIICDGNGRQLYTITEANGLCSNQVSYVAYDGHGVLWGATAKGIFAIELPSVYSYFLPKDGLTGKVQAITAYNGKIYVGETNGLFTVDAWQYKRVADISNICWTLCQERDALLAATSSGIYRIAADGRVGRLTSNATTALLVDGDQVYAGEPDGVHLYQAGKNIKINDLPLVTVIRKDARGNFWFKNVHGETATIGDYKAPADTSSTSSPLLTPLKDMKNRVQYLYDDHLWIGGDEILAIVDRGRKDLTRLTDSRHVRFCSIVMGNDSVLWGGYGDRPQKLHRLDSDERHLHFFYALDYSPLSGKTLYRYKLNDYKWSAWTDDQDVEFLNLPYGSFTLYVQAQLANGKLSEVASVDFTIAYPLLMRWYMIILYFIAFAYIGYLLFLYRLKRLKREKIKLEHIVDERTADLRNAQHKLIRQEKMATVGKLTEGLIDRILNPMNYIINFSKMSNDLLKDLKENIDHSKDGMDKDDYEDTLDILDMLTQNLQNVDQYGQNTTRTLKAMEEMLKDRTGGYVDMDLLPVLQQNEDMLRNYYTKEIEQYHIKITFTLPETAIHVHGNPEMLSKTIMSLLGNAVYAVVKKAGKGENSYTPEISLTVSNADAQYILRIHDNGIGIEEKILGKIFDPFFTTKTTGEASGVGLYLSREIIQNHGGDISVASAKDEYTEFTITLPNLQAI